MDSPDRIVNLKEEEIFIEQYVQLRNRYQQVLLTTPVNVAETRAWLKREDTEIIGIAQQYVLLGVAVLYLNRNGEIAFFVKDPEKGIGSRLLVQIERIAEEKKLDYVWAWVLRDNWTARKTFLKNGYVLEEESAKCFKDKILKGLIFRKPIGQKIRK